VSVVVHATNWEAGLFPWLPCWLMWLLRLLPGPPPSDEDKAMFFNNLYFHCAHGSDRRYRELLFSTVSGFREFSR
jgi:hypothetical protein